MFFPLLHYLLCPVSCSPACPFCQGLAQEASHFLVTAAHLGCGNGGKSGLCLSSTLFEMGTLGESQEVVIEGGKEEKSKHKRAGLGFLSH